MLARIGTATLHVTDQDKALEYYTGELGFEKRMDVPMGPGQRWTEVAPPGTQTRVLLYKDTPEMPWAETTKKQRKE